MHSKITSMLAVAITATALVLQVAGLFIELGIITVENSSLSLLFAISFWSVAVLFLVGILQVAIKGKLTGILLSDNIFACCLLPLLIGLGHIVTAPALWIEKKSTHNYV